jgi:hypothetical protein
VATITISGGTKVNAYGGDDGTFLATLTKFGDLVSTDNEGNALISSYDDKPYSFREWEWAIEDAPADANLIWGRTSGFTGPKSTTFGILTALFGGKAPPAGLQLTEKDIEGRQAMIAIHRDQTSGWYKVDSVIPVPASMRKGTAPAAPARAAAPAAEESLPF